VGQIALLVSFPGFLCVASSSPRPREGTEDRSATKAEIPFQLYNGNLIIVKATIGTVKNLNIILDTGTSPTMVSKDIADRLNLRGNTELQLTLNGVIQVQSVILSRIQIGGLHADSVRVVAHDLSFLEQKLGISVAGIAGLDILSASNFTIDYQRKRIVFGRTAMRGKSVHFETRAPFLTVKAKIEGHEVRLLLDSGTPGLLIYRNSIKAMLEQFHPDRDALVETAAGMMHSRWFLASTVSLGKENLGQRTVVIADLDSTGNDFDGLLGFAKMGFRKVSFDFENGLFGWE
jgi:hypothetical protein